MAQPTAGSLSRSMSSQPVFNCMPAPPDPSVQGAPVLASRPLALSFSMLFAEQPGDRPERPTAWRSHLPPLARLLAQLACSGLSSTAQQARVLEAIAGGLSVLDVDAVYGRPVLHWACILAPAELVRLLLDRGADVHARREDAAGNTPLHCVLRLRQPTGGAEVVNVLLEAGASPAALPRHGAELLYLHDLEMPLAQRLLALGVDIDDRMHETSPLLALAERRRWGLVSLLLEHGADATRYGPLRTTILHNGALPVWLAEQSRRRGVDLNARDLVGQTPLMRACAENNIPLARWLLAQGARTDAVAANGSTLLDSARPAGPVMLAWLQRQLSTAGGDD